VTANRTVEAQHRQARKLRFLALLGPEGGYEGPAMNFVGAQFDPVRLQTKPVIWLTLGRAPCRNLVATRTPLA